jgi:SAGA-associated factor 73
LTKKYQPSQRRGHYQKVSMVRMTHRLNDAHELTAVLFLLVLVSDVSVELTTHRPAKMSKKAEKRIEIEARRRAREEASEAKKNKKKKAILSARKKGPTDVDTQCGVINDKGLPCSRSLTCKSHSMGAKRSVQGRSRPYDELLLEWQKIHNPALVAKIEERERAVAASKAAAAERKSRKALEKKKRIRSRDESAMTADGTNGGSGGTSGTRNKESSQQNAANLALLKIQEDPLSDMFSLGFSEEEIDVEIKDLVAAIRSATNNERTKILPLAQRSFSGLYTRKSHTLRGCRELLREGLRSNSKGGPFGPFDTPFDASNAPSLIAAQAIGSS